MKKVILVISILFILVGCGSNGHDLTFDESNLISHEKLVENIKNPSKEDVGKSVAFGAMVNNDVGEEGDKHYYQLTLDPVNYELDVMIGVPKDQKLDTNQYVLVEGVIVGVFKGENVLGGEVVNLQITTESVKNSTFIEAIAPAIETVEINQTKDQHGVEILINKIELSEIDTRMYVEINNNSSDKVSIYSFDFKLVAGGKNYSEEFTLHSEYPDIDTDLAPNTSTSGIISFVPINTDDLSNFIIMVDSPYSENWELNFEDYVFEVVK